MIRSLLRPTLFLFLFAGALLAGCRDGEEAKKPAHQGPIVLITIDALRADMIAPLGGAPGLTPAFNRFARQADWSGRAVSASSWTVPAMAALWTGFQPWRTSNWSGDRIVLADELTTLPEALKSAGYHTAAFRSNHWLQKQYGYAQGFDLFQYLKEGGRAQEYLMKLQGGREFVWIHILPPHAPYIKRDQLLPRLKDAPPNLPQKTRILDLQPYFDPAVPLPPEKEREFRAMYALNAAWADELLGRMFQALKKSGQWDDALVVVTSDHGEEFKEHGQITHGGNLGRVLVEVPLAIKLPKGFGRKLAIAPGKTVATPRLWATLVEAAGGQLVDGVAPSLFEDSAHGALSELYQADGVNRFSLVDGGYQLLWENHFSPPEPEYWNAQLEALGGKAQPPLSEPADAIFKRIAERFDRTYPLTGPADRQPTLTLWRWTEKGGSEPVDDPSRLRQMARHLKASWIAANGSEVLPSQVKGVALPTLTAEDEAELRSLGYAAPRRRR
ncbi:MAG TPA: sulfatase [Thermoanaerobaculia bacterium]|nr:sulfatase [Thermoanaerobaculia bacterium]